MEHSSDSEEDIKADIPMDEISKKYGLDTYDEEEGLIFSVDYLFAISRAN